VGWNVVVAVGWNVVVVVGWNAVVAVDCVFMDARVGLVLEGEYFMTQFNCARSAHAMLADGEG